MYINNNNFLKNEIRIKEKELEKENMKGTEMNFWKELQSKR